MGDLISRKEVIKTIHRFFEKKIKDNFGNSEEIPMGELNPMLTDNKTLCGKIKEIPIMNRWIPCSERLPEEEHKLYWTTHEDGSIVLHSYTKKNGFILNWEVDDMELRKRQGGVVAWMLIPMPEPYKGE